MQSAANPVADSNPAFELDFMTAIHTLYIDRVRNNALVGQSDLGIAYRQ